MTFLFLDLTYVLGSFLQTAQTWANTGDCGASCMHALGSMCLLVCLFVCFTDILGDRVL